MLAGFKTESICRAHTKTWTACVAQNEQLKTKKKQKIDLPYLMLFRYLCNRFLWSDCMFLCLQMCRPYKDKKKIIIHWTIHCQTKIEQKQTPQEHISGHEQHPPFQPLPPQWSPQPPCSSPATQPWRFPSRSPVTLTEFKGILESDSNSKSELMTVRCFTLRAQRQSSCSFSQEQNVWLFNEEAFWQALSCAALQTTWKGK